MNLYFHWSEFEYLPALKKIFGIGCLPLAFYFLSLTEFHHILECLQLGSVQSLSRVWLFATP